MKVLKEFQIGSKAFFSKYEDFKPHDNDTLLVVDSGDGIFKYLYLKSGGNCIFKLVNRPKQELIDFAISTKSEAMQVGKYLVPDILHYFNFTIDDLKQLQPLIDNLDKPHLYEKIIYDGYIENNDFYLTDNQLDNAYKSYKDARPNVYK